ncbi:MAG: amino acid permease [Candidatus Eremiobacteraeota bacterium]|nr:amino acid permease [Candidatus Eremiobacteraeota bacterium]
MNRATPRLQRRLGVADFTLITIGAVIGSGIFRNPAVAAHRAHVPALIIACWIVGGMMALVGAFVFAELAARRPLDGGLYGYLRDAYGPLAGFLLGWMSLLIVSTGSTAASAVLFAAYLLPLVHAHADARIVAVCAIGAVTLINTLGLRQGSTWQNALVALKVLGIAGIIVAGFIAHPLPQQPAPPIAFASPFAWLGAAGVAMLPVLFSYMGFQSATYMMSETRDPSRTIPLGQIFGVGTVTAIYLLVNVASLRALGAAGLGATATPAADVMSAAFGNPGRLVASAVVAASTLGYMSNSVLCAPRLYFQMAADGLFFRQFAQIGSKTHVPAFAIALHGSIAAIIAASGTYGQIINWVTLPEWLFIMLVAAAVFVYRKRDAQLSRPAFTVPFHPWSTSLFITAVIGVTLAVVTTSPMDSAYAAAVFLAGIIFFFAWKALRRPAATPLYARPGRR